MRTLRTLAALALALAALVLPGCGGEDPAPASGNSGRQGIDAKTRQAMLAYARCMREQGIDMPDPTFDEFGGRVTQKSGARVTPEQQRAAEQACAKYQKQIRPPTMSAADKEKAREAALAFTRCMREQGIDMPDPQFEENGAILQRTPRGVAEDNSEKFRAAERACRTAGEPDGGSIGGTP